MDHTQYIVLFSAFRYALGRRTHVVNTIVREIHRTWLNHTKIQRELYCREILEHLSKFNNLGDRCDEIDWLSIVQRFQDENLKDTNGV